MKKKIETGVFALAEGGPYEVRVARRLRESEQVAARVDDLESARRLREDAKRLRTDGQDVRDVWIRRGLIAEDAFARAAKHSSARLFGADCKEFLDARLEQSKKSKHRRSGLDGKNSNLRPTTEGTQRASIRKHILEKLGGHRTVDLDYVVIRKWGIALADEGLAYTTQTSVHKLLRMIVGRLPEKRRPADFPWPALAAMDPAEPQRRPADPSKWDGPEGDALPSLVLTELMRITAEMRNCARIVVYLMFFAGLRRGEAMGLTLNHIVWTHGRLRLRINQQMDLQTGRILPWVKSRSGYRTIPVPRVLERYLLRYLTYYHDGFDPRTAHAGSNRMLVVTSTGRDVDGSFLSCMPGTWATWFHDAIQRAGLGFEAIGFDIGAHHIRRTFATYMRIRLDLLRTIEEQLHGPISEHETIDERVIRLEQRARALDAQFEAHHLDGADISSYMGHKRDNKQNDAREAARITTYYADRHVGASKTVRASYEGITQSLDAIFEFEIGGDLPFEPDRHDLAQILRPNDPDWMFIDDAVQYLPVTAGTLHLGLRQRSIPGELVYVADGDREVPGRRWAIRTEDVEALADRYNGLSSLHAAELVGVGPKIIIRLGDKGDLERHMSGMNEYPYYRRDDIVEVLRRILEVTLAVVEPGSSLTVGLIHQRLKADLVAANPIHDLIPMPSRLRPASTAYWVQVLTEHGALVNQRGWYRRGKNPDVGRAAKATVAAAEGRRFGADAKPENVAKRARKRPLPPCRAVRTEDNNG